MSLTKPTLAMIDAGANSQSGDFVQQTEQGLKLLAPGVTPNENLETFLLDYDKQTGVLSIQINNVIRRVSGLPTELNLPSGPTGQRGRDGKTGTSGRNGRDGAVGIQGCQGPKGDRGPKGATGATGERGIQGVIGPIGPTGATGATGPNGIDGTEPEYSVGVRNEAGSNTTSPSDTVDGENPYIRMQRSGAMIEWGRCITIGGAGGDAAVTFSRAFTNRVTGLLLFFTDPNSYQAQNYEIREYTPIDDDIGGFSIGTTGSPTLPHAEPWDFTWVAFGD